jgi:PAS domain S-box-containing protein
MAVAIEGWLRALFEASPLAIGFSRDGVTLGANAAYLTLFGYATADELRGRPILEQIAPSHREQILSIVAQRARGETPPIHYETRGIRKDGTEFPFEITTTRVVIGDGPLTIAFFSDLTERENAFGALRASEERFRTLSSAALEGVFVHVDGRIVLANEAGAAMYGFDPARMIGASVIDLTAPEDRDWVAENVRRGTSQPYEATARRKDGSTFVVEVRGTTLSHQGRPTRVAIIRDITERKRAEAEHRALAERVRDAQKLESLGVLAGGVAHDFNNILTVIANGIAFARQSSDLQPPTAEHLDVVAVAAARAADLCRQMLAYAGKGAFAREAVDVSALVGEMSNMLQVSVGKKVTLVRQLERDLPVVLGDATQIRQIVMNLVINAAEAVAAPRGTVRVSTGAGIFGKEELERSAAGGDPKPGLYAYVEVHDDGVGMDDATIAKMFDPFFTTKFVGRGLGMAVVLGIVRGHSGAVDVDSRPGAGTRIRVLLPASTTTEIHPHSSTQQPERRGKGVVLLVDDEDNVRVSTRLLLEGLGFDVIVARDGVEAIEVFRSQRHQVGAVMLDLTMPKMDGLEALAHLRRIDPAVPIVLTSGYGAMRGDDAPNGAPVSARPDAVLTKPYSEEQLRGTLQELLRRAR